MQSRYEYYTKLDTVNDIEIYDIFSIKWDDFLWTDGYSVHEVSYDEVLHPELISLMYYGTDKYEDFIYLLNNIEDPLNLIPGTRLVIPSLVDIQNFYRTVIGV